MYRSDRSSREIYFFKVGGSVAGVHPREEDIPEIERLVFEHGKNPWNYLPEDEVKKYLASLATDAAIAIVAEEASQGTPIVGVVTYEVGHRFPQYQPRGRQDAPHGYISEAVVHTDFAGKGVGTALIKASIENLTRKVPYGHGMSEVYAMRHSDNVSSATMMEKAGMTVIDEFTDPAIRPTGSGRTAVTRIMVTPRP